MQDLTPTFSVQGKDRDEKISILVSLGFSNAEIGKLIGVPKGTVDSIRAKSKKK
jgi:DNA-directed RNA polymerase specialized sigma24 family protein